jgi:branched-chain amino acid transport system ATP-binding protein
VRLKVRYGPALAIDDVSLTVRPGSRAAVVGPNGAGKSTLLKAIAGSVRIAEGRICWQGADVSRKPAHARVKTGIALVPEGRRTFSGLSVTENLRVGAFGAPSRFDERLSTVFTLFPALQERSRQPASTLSGGEAQMLAIGQALMSDPRLILLDEPSIGLAPMVVQSVLGTLRELSERGVAVLLVEQSAHLAARFSSDIHLLARGRLRRASVGPEGVDDEALREAYFGG